ncbi:MAG: hypothetical protein ATN35_10465 [Epulopiscium sp. Nele67-Bin004]|nr:MAG: hypothetical protein ATN35_10465 [Epulopiscium sp. Nele67-Bin004]
MGYKNRLGSRLQIRKIRPVFTTIFSRLVVVYLGIFATVLGLFYLVFTSQFRSYYIHLTQDTMVNHAQLIEEEFKSLEHLTNSPTEVLEKIIFKMQVIDSYWDTSIWIVDKGHNILIISDDPDSQVDEISFEIINEVFEGNIVRTESVFYEYFDVPVLTIGYPIIIYNSIEYALFLHSPMPAIATIVSDINLLTIQIMFGIGILLFIVVYIVSRELSGPLVAMNNTAKKIARGELDKRVDINAKDELGQLADSLNHMVGELEKMDIKRRTFVANVSHDMRSPLTSIQGFITAILDGTIPPQKQDKYLEIVLGETRRMIKMTNDILELGNLEESTFPMIKRAFDMHALIRAVLAHFEMRIVEKNITLNLILEEKEQEVSADTDKIIRVIQNLLDNAIKFVNPGGTVEIETVTQNNKLWVYFRNSGKNISPDELTKIWDRFYKTDTSRGQDKNGLGIGLVIVKEIVKQHKEEIIVSSDEGEMTQFGFSIERVRRSKLKMLDK